MDLTEIIFQDEQFDEESVDMYEPEVIEFDEDEEDNMDDKWDNNEYNNEYYNEEDESGADEEDDNDYSIDNLGQPSIDDQGSQDDIAKDFMASDYSSVIPYDRKDPIVRMAAPTQDDIAEARNHYEAMVRSTTIS